MRTGGTLDAYCKMFLQNSLKRLHAVWSYGMLEKTKAILEKDSKDQWLTGQGRMNGQSTEEFLGSETPLPGIRIVDTHHYTFV